MSIICKNGDVHTHDTVYQSKICWGVIKGFVSRPVSPTPVLEPATANQIRYVGTLGGDADYAAGLDKKGCSEYIKSLLANKGKPVTADISAPTARPKQERTKRQEFILDMIKLVPDGYFAVTPDGTDSNVTFLRVKRPTSGRLKGCLKVQTQHSEVLDDKFIYFTGSDRIWEKNGYSNEIEEALMFLMADWQGATMRYSRLIHKCCRCNLALTDDRSRWYGIGPDCEQVWPWMIEAIHDSKGVYRHGYGSVS
jgi:hypothetical protein